MKKFQNKDSDLVIRDVQMPGLYGLEMISKIEDINPHAKIIITSADDDRSISLGINNFSIKQLNLMSFLSLFLLFCIPLLMKKMRIS